jgi:hypothetical protein
VLVYFSTASVTLQTKPLVGYQNGTAMSGSFHLPNKVGGQLSHCQQNLHSSRALLMHLLELETTHHQPTQQKCILKD